MTAIAHVAVEDGRCPQIADHAHGGLAARASQHLIDVGGDPNDAMRAADHVASTSCRNHICLGHVAARRPEDAALRAFDVPYGIASLVLDLSELRTVS